MRAASIVGATTGIEMDAGQWKAINTVNPLP